MRGASPFSAVAALVALLLSGAAVRADAPVVIPAGDRPVDPSPSIHRIELDAWKAREAAGWAPWADPRDLPTQPLAGAPGGPSREVHGYHPYWMGSAYAGYDWSLLSTVAFFSLELHWSGIIVNDHGWPWTGLVSAAHAGGTRVLVTATLFSQAEITSLLSSPANRATAVANLVTAVTDGGADGVNIDFEGVSGSQKTNLLLFMDELGAALSGALADPYVSIATPAVDWSDAFDYDELEARTDHLMIMAYDYHWTSAPTTGPVAPLSGWDPYNVPWTVADYQSSGATPGGMLLGVPYYGYRWPAASGDPGSATTGSATARTYDQAYSEAATHGRLWDAESRTPWYRYESPGWTQCWYEDAESLALKYAYAEAESLAGVGIWALGYDGARPELWAALRDAFGTASAAAPVALPGAGARLGLPFPNPFRGAVGVPFHLTNASPARLTIHDASGRLLRVLSSGEFAAGMHRATWNESAASAFPAGVYFLRLEAEGTVSSRRLVRVK